LPNLKKDFVSEAEVLNELNADVLSIESYLSHPTMGAYPKHVPKEILQKGYYFEDSDDVIFASYDILGRKVSLTNKLGLGLDIGKFYIQEKEKGRINGYKYGVSLYYKHLTLRLGKNKYDDFTEFVPTLKYNDNYKRHEYQLEYTRQNALFYVYRTRALDEKITTDHFSFSDYISWRDKTSLWSGLELNAFSNNDIEFVAQFDWRFFYHKVKDSDFSYDLAIEGWYDTHTKKTDSYYSPNFADTTLLRVDIEYQFSKYFGMRAIAGAGYSFHDKYVPYKYGMNIFGSATEELLYDIGCLYSNSLRNSDSSNYKYLECNFSLGYSW